MGRGAAGFVVPRRVPTFIRATPWWKKHWEITADNLTKAGWSLGYVSAIDSNGRTIFVADAHGGDGKRFVVHADEKLTAFMELESAIRASNGRDRAAVPV
jgi:hypothetical protein